MYSSLRWTPFQAIPESWGADRLWRIRGKRRGTNWVPRANGCGGWLMMVSSWTKGTNNNHTDPSEYIKWMRMSWWTPSLLGWLLGCIIRTCYVYSLDCAWSQRLISSWWGFQVVPRPKFPCSKPWGTHVLADQAFTVDVWNSGYNATEETTPITCLGTDVNVLLLSVWFFCV